MNQVISMLLSLILLAPTTFNASLAKGEEYNKPIPQEALALLKQAYDLRRHAKFDDAVTVLKKVLAIAPNYVEAHKAYIETKDYYLERDDEIRAEYDALQAREPNNPVYLMAQILAYPAVLTKSRQAALQRVAEQAPDWAWGHFAKAMLVKNSNFGTAITELRESIKLDRTAREPYLELIAIYNVQRDYDLAMEVAKTMTHFPDNYRDTGLYCFWDTRYKKARSTSAEEVTKLITEFAPLADAAQDWDTLLALYGVNAFLLHDKGLDQRLGQRLQKMDPTWDEMTQFGFARTAVRALGEENRTLGIYGQQHKIWQEAAFGTAFSRELLPSEKIERLEKLLERKPGRRVTEMIYQFALQEAEKADDLVATLKYGEALLKIDPQAINPPIRMALALAAKKVMLDKALSYARTAEAATADMKRPIKQRDVDPFRYQDSLLEENQRPRYVLTHSTALNALGWVLYQMGNYAEAEAKLQQAVALRRDKDNLYHWAAALNKVGKTEEAAKITSEADNLLASFVKDEMSKARREPAIGFTLETVDGRKVSLADLKGKIVMINFWATWCGPCIKELPEVKRLYEKYKDKGFEILAISGDVKADRQAVINFAKKREMSFPVLFDEGVMKQYSVSAIPTNIIVDREGRVRYRLTGGGDDGPKSLEIALNELLK